MVVRNFRVGFWGFLPGEITEQHLKHEPHEARRQTQQFLYAPRRQKARVKRENTKTHEAQGKQNCFQP